MNAPLMVGLVVMWVGSALIGTGVSLRYTGSRGHGVAISVALSVAWAALVMGVMVLAFGPQALLWR